MTRSPEFLAQACSDFDNLWRAIKSSSLTLNGFPVHNSGLYFEHFESFHHILKSLRSKLMSFDPVSSIKSKTFNYIKTIQWLVWTDSKQAWVDQFNKSQTHAADKLRKQTRKRQKSQTESAAHAHKDPRQTLKANKKRENTPIQSRQGLEPNQRTLHRKVKQQGLSKTQTYKVWSFLPPPLVSSQGFQLKWGGAGSVFAHNSAGCCAQSWFYLVC